jgi:Tol biopolymer transport system component
VQGNDDIWLLDGARTSRFTSDPGVESYPLWSPDGRTIVFDSNRKGRRDLNQKPSSGVGEDVLLLESGFHKAAQDWSPDGRFLLYWSNTSSGDTDLWVLPVGHDGASIRAGEPFIFLKTNFRELHARFSPDGRFVAYTSYESGQSEVYLRPFLGPPEPSAAAATAGQGRDWRVTVSTAGGIMPKWSPDGKELYYIDPNAVLMAAPITVNGPTLEAGTPVPLFQTKIVGNRLVGGQGRQYDLPRDGRFLININEDEVPITVIVNWAAALQ